MSSQASRPGSPQSRLRQRRKKVNRWWECGQALKRLRIERDLTQGEILSKLEALTGHQVWSDDAYIRRVERGEAHVPRDILKLLLIKVYEVDHIPTINRILRSAGYGPLSRREIKEEGLEAESAP